MLRDILYCLALMVGMAVAFIGVALLWNTLAYGPLDKRRVIKPEWYDK